MGRFICITLGPGFRGLKCIYFWNASLQMLFQFIFKNCTVDICLR